MADLSYSDLMATAQPTPQPQGIWDKLAQTWPAQLAQAAWSAVQAPGNAYASTPENPVTTEQMIKPAADLAGLMTMGSFAAPAESNAVGAGVRAYQNAPDNLMGFRKNGPQKGYHESNYKTELPVKIDLGDGEVFEDAIKGLNKSHALERAYRNWPNAVNIEPLK